jgi:hypothetical protein
MRQFLLGHLDEKEREELEQLVLSDAHTREKLLMVEDDLIEDYLEGSLAGDERDEFLHQFLSIPHQRNKLKIAKSLLRLARADAEAMSVTDTRQIEPEPTRQPRGSRSFLVYLPIAAGLVIAVTVGAIWLVKYRGNVAREKQIQAIESELVQLNASRENLPADQIATLIVPAISPRSVAANSSLTLERRVLELWLPPGPKQTERYDAVIQRVGGEGRYQIPDLRLQDHAGEKVVRLRIFTRLLSPGTYRVRLNGLTPDGSVADTGEYTFEIQ